MINDFSKKMNIQCSVPSNSEKSDTLQNRKEFAVSLVITGKTSFIYQEFYKCKFLSFHFSSPSLCFFLNLLAAK